MGVAGVSRPFELSEVEVDKGVRTAGERKMSGTGPGHFIVQTREMKGNQHRRLKRNG